MVMRKVRTALLAGTAAVAVAGLSGVALARDLHVMTVRLPGGGVAEIRYTGDAARRLFWARFAVCGTRPDLGGDESRSGEPDSSGGNAGKCAGLCAQSANRDGSGQSAAGNRELLDGIDVVRQRRLHPERRDHLAGQWRQAARRVAQLRQLSIGTG